MARCVPVVTFVMWLLCSSGGLRPAAGDPPHRITRFPDINAPNYAWSTDGDLLVWGTASGAAAFARYNLSTGVRTEIKPWAPPREPLSGRIDFSRELPGYGAWLETPYFGQTGDVTTQICARAFNWSKSLNYELGIAEFWCDPVWCKIGRDDMLVVLGRDAAGPAVIVFDLVMQLPYRVEHFPLSSPLAGAIPGLVDVIGSNKQGRAFAVSRSPDEGKAIIIAVDATRPSVTVETHQISFPDPYVEADVTLCGDKIVWLLEKIDTDAALAGRLPNPGYEIWTSNVDASHLARMVQIVAPAGSDQPASSLNPPRVLRAKPRGDAVTYLRGSGLYILPIK